MNGRTHGCLTWGSREVPVERGRATHYERWDVTWGKVKARHICNILSLPMGEKKGEKRKKKEKQETTGKKKQDKSQC